MADAKNANPGKRLKGKLPSKTTLNLVYKEKDSGKSVLVTLIILLALAAIGAAGYFFVKNQLKSLDDARERYEIMQETLLGMKEENADLDSVMEEYSHYGSSYMNDDELAMQDRLKILEVINNNISLAMGLSKVQLSGNTATVELISDNLSAMSDIVHDIEESDIVRFVTLGTATMDANSSLSRLNRNLVKGMLTIEFKSPTGQASEAGTSEGLLSTLADRKSTVENMGEEAAE